MEVELLLAEGNAGSVPPTEAQFRQLLDGRPDHIRDGSEA
jgi:hypothetical protein